MLIKSLEIQGFKSFPDKTVLSFGKGITAIVGPNGSGKSNLSDAVRWVLGEQSTKSLRGSKMEDVVFSGTALRKAQGFAQVTLVIDNTDRRLPFDGDEIAVSRRYYRSGESEYLINRATVRLRDVNELFMDTGMGRDGYSIISQGKIADIVGAKSEDRREIFEEAAGISKYRYRKEEAERRLSHAEENLLRLKDIMVELEDRVVPLQEQAEKARKFLEYSEEKRSVEIGVWMHSLERSSKQLRQQNEKVSIAETQHRDMEKKLKKLQLDIENAFSEYNRKASEIDEIRRSIAEKEETAARRDGEISVLENDIFHNNENQQRVKSEIDGAASSAQELEERIAEKQRAIAAAQEQTVACETELQEKTAAQERLRAESETYDEKIAHLNQEIATLASRHSDAKVEAVTAESSLGEIELHAKDTAQKLQELQQEALRLEASLTEYTDALKEYESHALELTNAAKGYSMRLESSEKKEETLKSQANQLQMEIQEREQRAKLLEDLEKNLEGFAHSVKLVMKESQHGTLRGIHGPVSRLINVPEKYAIAIEIGLGGAMQNIVCSGEEDAKRAIAMLKRTDGGRATFLPLTAVKGSELNENGLDDCIGFIGIASQLVTCDPQYENIKKSLLGRIVVAEDLDAAVGIAKRYGYRFRIVTLDGQVVNAGGSLTGGSLAKNAGLLNRTNEIRRLRAEADTIRQKYNILQDSVKSATETVSQLKASMGGVQAELATNQEDKVRVETELRNVRSRKNACDLSLSQLEREQQTSTRRVTELQTTLQKAQEIQQACRQEREQKESELLTLSDDQKKFIHHREELSEQIAEIRLRMVALEKDRTTLLENIREIHALQSDRAAHTQELQMQLSQLASQQEEYKSRILALREETAQLRTDASAAEETIARLTQERLTLEQTSVELRQKERNMSSDREAIARDMARLEEQMATLQKDYDDIVRRLWEEYELTPSEAEEAVPALENITEGQRRLSELKSKIKALGSVNVAAIEEYAEVSQRYEFLKAQIEDVEKSRDELNRLLHDLTSQMKVLFMERFHQIDHNFRETFRELFGGGTAGLRLTNEDDVLSSGIEISVQPQGKIITNLDALSGGEKSLTAIALYFAIMKVSPTPFCILDEIEAALDDVNVDRFASYLRRMSDNTQFIAITHRRGTMEEADVLYGVTMQEEGVSKLLALDVSEIEQKLGTLS